MTEELKARIAQIGAGTAPAGYKKTKVGIVPEEWETVRLESICTMKSGDTITAKDIDDCSPYPCYGGNGLRGFTSSYTHSGEYVLIGRQGALCGNVKLVNGQFYASEHAIVVTNSDSICRFTFYLFDWMNLNKYSESSAQPGLSVEKILRLKIAIPPLPEQQKIAEILTAQDEVIALMQKRIELKQQQKKAIMQKLLSGAVRVGDGEWIQVKLGTIFKERVEQHCEDLELLAITGKSGVIPRSQLDLKDNSSEDKSKYLKICQGDIGYNTMRMWQGVSAYSNYTGIVSPAYTVLIPSEKVNALFFAYLFKMPHMIFLFYRFSQGLVDDTRNLKYTNFKQITVYYPADKSEQTKIAKLLSAQDREIELLQQQLTLEQQKKKALMQLVLTGKVRCV